MGVEQGTGKRKALTCSGPTGPDASGRGTRLDVQASKGRCKGGGKHVDKQDKGKGGDEMQAYRMPTAQYSPGTQQHSMQMQGQVEHHRPKEKVPSAQSCQLPANAEVLSQIGSYLVCEDDEGTLYYEQRTGI